MSSISIEDVKSPQLDLEAAEDEIENEPKSPEGMMETSKQVESVIPAVPQADLARVIYDLVAAFKNASVDKMSFDYNHLREAVCATIRRDRPEWSDHDLEAAYDRFAKGDPEINAMIVAACGPFSTLPDEASSLPAEE